MISALLIATIAWQKPTLFCQITDQELNESSGLSASPTQNGVLYTHNDSGDTARFWRFDTKGKVTGIFSLKGIKAIDWEEMAAAKVGGKSYLYLGDIGDNARKRKDIQIHRVEEPASGAKSGEISRIETFTITYPDQARDCEGFFVTGSGDIWLITKARDNETVVYTLPSPKKPGAYKLTKVANLDVDTQGLGGKLVTGAAVSPNQKEVVIRTYTGALLFTAPRAFGNWVKSRPTSITLPAEKQGEAISFTRDSRDLLTSSEGTPCPISLIKR